MKETKTQEIGNRGFTYSVEQLGARQGGRVFARIANMLGGALGSALSGGESFSVDSVGKVFASLAESITEENLDYLVDTFIPTTKVAGGQLPAPLPLSAVDPDQHFAGAYGEMMQWLGFCLEVNYASFLPGGSIAATVAMFKAKAEAKASEQPPASDEEAAASESP